MNNTRRKLIDAVAAKLEEALSDLEPVLSDEREWVESKSEKWRESDKGSEAVGVVENLDTVYGDLETMIQTLYSASAEPE